MACRLPVTTERTVFLLTPPPITLTSPTSMWALLGSKGAGAGGAAGGAGCGAAGGAGGSTAAAVGEAGTGAGAGGGATATASPRALLGCAPDDGLEPFGLVVGSDVVGAAGRNFSPGAGVVVGGAG